MQVTDYPDRLDKIGLYLDAVQNRATRQVSIQAKVIEVELNDEFSAGINWSLLLAPGTACRSRRKWCRRARPAPLRPR